MLAPNYNNDIPASKELLDRLSRDIILPAISGVNVTFTTYKGSGHLSLIKHLATVGNATGPVFIPLDLRFFYDKNSSYINYSLNFLLSNFPHLQNNPRISDLKSNLESQYHGLGALYKINELFRSMDQKLIFITTNLGGTNNNSASFSEVKGFLDTIRQSNPKGTFFIHIIQHELGENFNLTHESFNQYVKNGKDYILLEQDLLQVVSQFTYVSGINVSEEIKKDLVNIFIGDPLMLKHSLRVLSMDWNLWAADFDTLYSSLGKAWVDSRMGNLYKTLGSDSLGFLKNLKISNKVPTKFLLDSGLYNENSGMFLNKFSHEYTSNFAKTITNSTQHLDDRLSGTQYLIYKVLLDNRKEIVSREQIAQTIWGDKWELEFSDWALDRHMSDLRKKLRSAQSESEIKSIKGKGYMLV